MADSGLAGRVTIVRRRRVGRLPRRPDILGVTKRMAKGSNTSGGVAEATGSNYENLVAAFARFASIDDGALVEQGCVATAGACRHRDGETDHCASCRNRNSGTGL